MASPPAHSSVALRRNLAQTNFLLFLLCLVIAYFLSFYLTELLFMIYYRRPIETSSYFYDSIPCSHDSLKTNDAIPRKTMHVMTDKPIYRPGEKIYLRGIELWASDPKLFQKPIDPLSYKEWNVQILNAAGNSILYEQIREIHLETSDSSLQIQSVLQPHPDYDFLKILSATWTIPDTVDGGDYTLKLSRGQDYPEGSRDIQIRTFRNPMLKISVDFLNSGYGPGDQVKVKIRVDRTEDSTPPEGADVEVSVNLFKSIPPSKFTVDKSGEIFFKFFLSEEDVEGKTTVSVTVMDDGVVESVSKSIPIVSNDLIIQFFPEGGDIVTGLENRIYFQISHPSDDIIHMTGMLLSTRNGRRKGEKKEEAKKIMKVETVHEGRGSFSFTPLPHHSYHIQLSKPKSVKKMFHLPRPKRLHGYGLNLHAGSGIFSDTEPVNVTVTVTAPQKDKNVGVHVTLFKGSFPLASQTVRNLLPGVTRSFLLPLPAQQHVTGVLRLTAFISIHGSFLPISERLIFYRSMKKLTVNVLGEKEAMPGEEKKYEIFVKDENDEPVSGAVLSVSVSDASTVAMIEPRRRTPNLAAMAFLEKEVYDLKDSNRYLHVDGDSADADVALDLLLGTQGWRRFAYSDDVSAYGDGNGVDAVVDDSNGDGEDVDHDDEHAHAVVTVKGVRKLNLLNDYSNDYSNDWETERKKMERMEKVNGIKRHTYSDQPCIKTIGSIISFFSFDIMHTVFSILLHHHRQFSSYDDKYDISLSHSMHSSLRSRYKSNTFHSERMNEQEIRVEEAYRFERFNSDTSTISSSSSSSFSSASSASLVKSFAMDDLSSIDVKREYAKDAFSTDFDNRFQLLRSNFSETLFFGEVMTDENGKAILELTLSHSITTFIISVNAHTNPPVLPHTLLYRLSHLLSPRSAVDTWHSFGVSDSATIQCRMPFYMDAKLPPQLTSGDVLNLSLIFVNAVDIPFHVSSRLSFSKHFRLQETSRMDSLPPNISKSKPEFEFEFELQSQQRDRHVFSLNTDSANYPDNENELHDDNDDGKDDFTSLLLHNNGRGGEGRGSTGLNGFIRLHAHAQPLWKGKYNETRVDYLQKKTKIYPSGFPSSRFFSSFIEPSSSSSATFRLPLTVESNSVSLRFVLYPSLFSRFPEAINGLVQEPHGCFEQMSSILYPNIMAHQYFLENMDEVNDKLIKKSKKYIEEGYVKLLKYEIKGGGFSWFGNNPPIELLSAYSLLLFHDMAKVTNISSSVNERTVNWLLDRRDKFSQNFFLNSNYLDPYGAASKKLTCAYILWAITTAGYSDGFQDQVKLLEASWKDSKDPYFLSLTALTFFNLGQTDSVTPILKLLRTFLAHDGSFQGSQTSIVGSGGRSLQIETTALAVLALTHNPEEFKKELKSAVDWLTFQCDDGLFGSTQGTVLALKAFLAYESAKNVVNKKGKVHLHLNKQKVKEIKISKDEKSAMAFSFPKEMLNSLLLESFKKIKIKKDGDGDDKENMIYDVNVNMDEGFRMPFSIQLNYNDKLPSSSPNCPLSLHLHMQKERMEEGEMSTIEFRLKNIRNHSLPMVVAIVGIPSGLEIPYEQFRTLKNKKLISFFEVTGREIVFYWNQMNAEVEISFFIRAQASIPGQFTAPASRAYLYYTKVEKVWHKPLKCSVAAKLKASNLLRA